jgi:phytoene dehydrogenase-like protein
MANVVIIGGGVSGLSAGIYARKLGLNAIICERHKIAGGNLTGWRRGEYQIDNCIHWLTGTNPHSPFHRTWQELGALGDIPVHQPEALFTCETNGKTLSAYRDLERFEREALTLSPADEQEIRAFTTAIRILREWMHVAPAFESDRERAKLLLSTPKLLRYLRLSTGELSKRFTHPLLKKFMVCMLGKDFGALALVFTLATFCGNDGGIPQGGSQAMAERIKKRFLELGGELKTGKTVTKVHTDGKRVTAVELSNGSILNADYVICACDPKPIFEKALGRKLPAHLQSLYANPKQPRFSSVHAAFSCDVKDLPFRGDYIFELPRLYKKHLHSHFLVVREFSHEPNFAPEGKTVLQAMVFCDEKTAKGYIELRKTPTAYRAKKRELAELFQTAIAEKFPSLRGRTSTLDVWTPATYERFTGAETGSYMSFLLPKNKLPIPVKSTVSGLQNFFLATQWQQPPGGLPTAASLGKRAAEIIAKREGQRLPFLLKKKRNKRAFS